MRVVSEVLKAFESTALEVHHRHSSSISCIQDSSTRLQPFEPQTYPTATMSSFQIFIANDKNTGGGSDEPANFNPSVTPGKDAVTFSSLTGKQKVLATSISHNKDGVELVVQGNGQTIKVKGNGTPVKLDGGNKIDIAQWTVKA